MKFWSILRVNGRYWCCVGLSDGVHRFSELKQRIEGVSEKMLSQTLKTLEHDGFILRTVYPVVPPKVEYQLTILGSQAAEKTMYLIGWIEKSLPEILESKERVAALK